MVFLSNVYTVFLQVLMLAILVTVGFLGDRLRFFTEKAAAGSFLLAAAFVKFFNASVYLYSYTLT